MEHDMDESGSSSLSEFFGKCLELWHEIEESSLPSSDNEYQDNVKKAILMLENVTRMVNRIGMFSSNESIEEVASADIKFLILPALLGYFNMKIQPSKFSASFRLDQLLLAEEYYKDFLNRCKSYEVPDVDIPDNIFSKSESNGENVPFSNAMSFQKMAADRDAAVARYKKAKLIDTELAALKANVSSLDDESLREYHMLLLKRWIIRALEELNSLQMEKTIVQSSGKVRPQDGSKNKPIPKPLKPIILVRTDMQKKVFGVGYPSIPTMTVDEFYSQRYPDEKNNQASASPLGSLQQMAADPEGAARERELEEAEEEEKVERDDPEYLKNTRAFDDWKDENRRGSGNRKNKG